MRLSHAPSALLSLLTILLSIANPASAKPYPRDVNDEKNVFGRACATPCGVYGQLCCSAGQYCFTDSAQQAQCGAAQVTGSANPSGSWVYFTTTIVDTELVTRVSTWSSFVVAAQTPALTSPPAASPTCNFANYESPCGPICCASGQFCLTQGQCAQGEGSSGINSGNTFSAPLRPTSGAAFTPTITVPFQTPVGTAGGINYGPIPSHSGLSGGAIAGIVIGVLFAFFLLSLLILCCCARGLLDALLGIFGLGRRRRRTETVVTEEHYSSHHGSHHNGRPHTGWFGGRPTRVDRPPKKSSGLGGWGALGAALAGLAIILGLRRRDREKSSYGSGSSYSYTSYTDESRTTSDSE
jgi:hypothetical protein